MSKLSELWDESEWFPPAVVVTCALAALLVVIWLGVFGSAVVNRWFAADAFRQCSTACGAAGVRSANPDYKCECNGTQRIEGHPSLDVNLKSDRAP